MNGVTYYIKENKMFECFKVSTQNLSDRILNGNIIQKFNYSDGFTTVSSVIEYMKKYLKED